MNKLEKMLDKKLSTLVLEIDVSKTDLSVRKILNIISQLEQQELSDNDLEIKDLYFK